VPGTPETGRSRELQQTRRRGDRGSRARIPRVWRAACVYWRPSGSIRRFTSEPASSQTAFPPPLFRTVGRDRI